MEKHLTQNDEYYCPKCNSALNEQEGFNSDLDMWTCKNCGQFLFGDIKLGERFPDIAWICDSCGELLNKQDGFTDTGDKWICTKCGHEEYFNIIIENNDNQRTIIEKLKDGWIKSKPTIIKVAKWTVGIGLALCAAVALEKQLNDENSLSSMSDDELNEERERIRKEFCSSGDDFEKASRLQNMLYAIDDEIRSRNSGDEETGYPVHTEHGWYLSEDDD